MALENTVIATEAEIKERYKHNCDWRYQVLSRQNFLPLTVKKLATKKGRALLSFANWVYVSGYVSSRSFQPEIEKSPEFVEYLVTNKLRDLGRFTNGHLRENSGAYGRLLHAMGIIIPAKEHKTYTARLNCDRLPHYFTDILNAKPSGPHEQKQRQELLNDIVRVLLKDRLKKRKTRASYFIDLKQHSSREQAEVYGASVVDFLNKVLGENSLFSRDALHITHNHSKGIYLCRIPLNKSHVNYFGSRPHLLDTAATY